MNTMKSERAAVLAVANTHYNADLVRINEAQINSIELPKGELTPMSSDVLGMAAGESAESAAEYLLILNALNFRFWDLVDGEFTRYEYSGQVGALGMRKAFAEAWGREQRWSSHFWYNLVMNGVTGLFGNIPAAQDRAVILDVFNGLNRAGYLYPVTRRIVDTARNTGRFTMEDAKELALSCPLAYGDRYLKKAQLMLAEYASFFSEVSAPVDCSDFTLFADYQLPRVMRALGLIEYCEALAEKIERQELIAEDSAEELAIRAATIIVGERLSKKLGCTTAQLDNYLWLNRKKATGNFHLTETTNY